MSEPQGSNLPNSDPLWLHPFDCDCVENHLEEFPPDEEPVPNG